MAKVMRTCQVCGKEYEYCHTLMPTVKFRWQNVACCYEHGQIWLEKLNAINEPSCDYQNYTSTTTDCTTQDVHNTDDDVVDVFVDDEFEDEDDYDDDYDEEEDDE